MNAREEQSTDDEATDRARPTVTHRSLPRRIAARWGAASIAFTIIAVLFGSLFAWITPPFWGHDEITQFGRSYQVSTGGFLPQRIDDPRGIAFGGDVPTGFTRLMGYAFDDYTNNGSESDPLVADPVRYAGLESAAPTDSVAPVWFTNTAAYSPVPYVPSAAGLVVARALDLSVGASVLVARSAGVLTFALIIGFGLHALRGRRVAWLVFAVSLLPIAVFQAGTVTADTLTNATAIMLSALLLKALFLRAQLTRVQTIVLLGAVLVLPLCKPTYVVLALLALLVPGSRLAWPTLKRWPVALTAAAGLALFAAWTSVSAGTTEGMGLMRQPAQWYSVIPSDQFSAVLSDPIAFFDTFVRTLALRDQLYFVQFFGQLGFGYVDVPATGIVAAIVAIVLAAGIAERFTATRAAVWTVALAMLASVGMIFGTLYLSFSPVGYFIIDGVQGRYFVPLAVLIAAVALQWISLRLRGDDGRVPVRGTVIGVVVATVISVAAAAARYYFVVWG